MSKAEEKILEFFKKNSIVIFGIIITFLAVVVRIQGRWFRSDDMRNFLLPWYEEIKALGGLKAIGTQVGDYNITYQIVIAIMSYIPFNPMYLYKGFSMVFDFLLAGVSALVTYELKGRKSKLWSVLTYTAVIFLPTVILNSSFWGQCDSIYTFFVVLTLYLLLRDKEKAAFIVLGIALAFKLQAGFIIPFLLIYYVIEKRYSILYLLFSLASFYIMALPGVLAGRSVLAPFELYLAQVGKYPCLCANFPSFLVFFGDSREAYNVISPVLFAPIIALLGVYLLCLLHSSISLYRTKYFILAAAWCEWSSILFLPGMQERYAYLADILLLLVAFKDNKYMTVAIPAVLCSVVTYTYYLFDVEYNLAALSAIYIAIYCIYSGLMLRDIMKDRKRS